MDFHRLPDTAARQTIDSTRVFREYLRVRRELEALAGSLFWKWVGEYEYLAHKVRGRTTYRGVRSAQTEAEFDNFHARKLRLKARLQSLQESVRLGQRMNKAVHAGQVPPALIDLLNLLEANGLVEHSLMMGWPALYAYGQSSGVDLQPVLRRHPHRSGWPRLPACVRLLMRLPAQRQLDIRGLLVRELSGVADVDVEPTRLSHWIDVRLRFRDKGGAAGSSGSGATASGGAKLSVAHGGLARKASRRAAPVEADQPSTRHAGGAGMHLHWLDELPCFEQVVVGKTGKMALMRTLDPKAYATVMRQVWRAARPSSDEVEPLPLRVVEAMIDESMVASQLDASAQRSLEQEVGAWVESSDPSGWLMACGEDDVWTTASLELPETAE